VVLKCFCLANCLNFQEKVVLVAHTVIPRSQLLLEFPFALQMGDQKLANLFPQEPKTVWYRSVIYPISKTKSLVLLKSHD
jgi:hypothetical protein